MNLEEAVKKMEHQILRQYESFRVAGLNKEYISGKSEDEIELFRQSDRGQSILNAIYFEFSDFESEFPYKMYRAGKYQLLFLWQTNRFMAHSEDPTQDFRISRNAFHDAVRMSLPKSIPL